MHQVATGVMVALVVTEVTVAMVSRALVREPLGDPSTLQSDVPLGEAPVVTVAMDGAQGAFRGVIPALFLPRPVLPVS